MPTVTVKAGRLRNIAEALEAALTLTPPPTPKGRYALAKAAQAIKPAVATLQAEQMRHINEHATKNEKGEPDIKPTPNGHGILFKLADAPAYEKAIKDLFDEDIELAGIRQITHAELGDCPITAAQEAELLGVLIEDKEPE